MSNETFNVETLDYKDIHTLKALANIGVNFPDYAIDSIAKLKENNILDDIGNITSFGIHVLTKYMEQTKLQSQIVHWAKATFDQSVLEDTTERTYRFAEEAAELQQSLGISFYDYIKIGLYVWGREPGEVEQEFGGVYTTLSILGKALDIDIEDAARTELNRIWSRISQIQEKQKNKPRASPLPGKTDAQLQDASLNADLRALDE